MAFVHFMSGSMGRGIRVALGLALIIWGIALGSVGGLALAVFGLAPLLSGVTGVCPITPLLKARFESKAAD
ncbi:hypothetical protein GALL_472850 [mine drainage metagenome]|uniref:Inner membrane protein YgaP-like transmembrane domain-containing protein n=1 Tax=mine drainage metagenome TaxID=410659 RepID=A0A1J5PU29_9ZZZZ